MSFKGSCLANFCTYKDRYDTLFVWGNKVDQHGQCIGSKDKTRKKTEPKGKMFSEKQGFSNAYD